MVESLTSQLLMVEAPCSAGQAPNFVQTPKPSIWSENRIPSKKWMVERGIFSPMKHSYFRGIPMSYTEATIHRRSVESQGAQRGQARQGVR
jgi:hypothetical protein